MLFSLWLLGSICVLRTSGSVPEALDQPSPLNENVQEESSRGEKLCSDQVCPMRSQDKFLVVPIDELDSKNDESDMRRQKRIEPSTSACRVARDARDAWEIPSEVRMPDGLRLLVPPASNRLPQPMAQQSVDTTPQVSPMAKFGNLSFTQFNYPTNASLMESQDEDPLRKSKKVAHLFCRERLRFCLNITDFLPVPVCIDRYQIKNCSCIDNKGGVSFVVKLDERLCCNTPAPCSLCPKFRQPSVKGSLNDGANLKTKAVSMVRKPKNVSNSGPNAPSSNQDLVQLLLKGLDIQQYNEQSRSGEANSMKLQEEALADDRPPARINIKVSRADIQAALNKKNGSPFAIQMDTQGIDDPNPLNQAPNEFQENSKNNPSQFDDAGEPQIDRTLRQSPVAQDKALNTDLHAALTKSLMQIAHELKSGKFKIQDKKKR